MPEDIMKERVRSLEVANEFHKDSLADISKTLGEVVKVQTMLANQREQIVKIVESLENITRSMHEYDKRLNQYKFTLDEIEKDFGQLLSEFNKTKEKTERNSRVVKIGGYILTAILVPMIIGIVTRLF